MSQTNPDLHLSQIGTLWSLVGQAHAAPGVQAGAARRQLLERYGGAVRRYLHGAVRDPDAADELFQEFACRFLRGDLHGADRGRGRFRDYVKGVLFHLVADHHKRQQRRPRPLPANYPGPAEDPAPADEQDRAFLASWREELLARSWAGLEAVERQTGQPFYTVLRFRAEHPDMPSPRMAAELGPRLGKPVTAAGVRQTLHRARERFADLLLDEIADALETPTPEHLGEELADLGLLDHCRPALERRGGRRLSEPRA
jgi:RNA polymerase sigma factor (sigma-70 family)